MRYLFIFCVLITACKKDEPTPPAAAFEQGVFVINEGLFNQTSGTISFFNPDSSEVRHDIFKEINNRDLGNVLQSLTIYGGKAYSVVNNSHKIEVCDAKTFEEIATINGLAQPRYLLALSASRALVSQWGTDGLTGGLVELDLANNSILQTIPTRNGAEQLLLDQNKVYLTCTGGYGTDSVVQIIDTQNNYNIEKTLTVGDFPNSLQKGIDGNIWVACAGKTVYTSYPQIDSLQSTASALVAIRPSDQTIVQRIDFQKGYPLTDLVANADGSRLFFAYKGQIWSFNPQNTSYTPILNGDFYGLGFSNNEQLIYAARNAGIERAWVLRCTPTGAVVDSFRAGVFANGFVFQ